MSKNRCSFEGSSYCREEQQGLRILIVNLANANASSKQLLVVKPIFALDRIIQSASCCCHPCDDRHDRYGYCYLRSCHLCHKTLPLKEVYMYRGDLGFCSVECRDRQMYIDEMKEIETSTQKVLASFRQQCRPVSA